VTLSLSEFILVSRLRTTRCLDHGRIEQIFDAVNCPGLCVICISAMGADGDLGPVSQTYEFGGQQYDQLDDALLAWGDIHSAEEAL